MRRSALDQPLPRKVTITSQTDVVFQANEKQLAEVQRLMQSREFRDYISQQTAKIVLAICSTSLKELGVKID